MEEHNQKAIDVVLRNGTPSTATCLHRSKIDKQRLQLTQRNKRVATLRKRVAADADHNDQDSETAFKNLSMKAESAHLFKYLAKVYTKQKGSGITHIEVPYKDAQGQLTEDPLTATE